MNSGDEVLQTAAAFAYVNSGVNNPKIFDAIIATKNPIVVNRFAGAGAGFANMLSLDQGKKLYALSKDSEFIKACNEHKDKTAKAVPNAIVKDILFYFSGSDNKEEVNFAKQVYKETPANKRNDWVYGGLYFKKDDAMDMIRNSNDYRMTSMNILVLASSRAPYITKKEFDEILAKVQPMTATEAKFLNRKLSYFKDEISENYTVVKQGESLRGKIARHVLAHGLCKQLKEVSDNEAIELAKKLDIKNLNGTLLAEINNIRNNGDINHLDFTFHNGNGRVSIRQEIYRLAKEQGLSYTWDDERRMKAAMEYGADFEKEISAKIGVTQANLKAGQVIDFSKVGNYDNPDAWPQPNWINWKIWY